MDFQGKALVTSQYLSLTAICFAVAFAVLLPLSIAFAESELDTAISECGETYRTCYTKCGRKEETYIEKKNDCEMRQQTENNRYQTEMRNCADSWDHYRNAIEKNYEKESSACVTADCRSKTLIGYNTIYNSSWVGQYTCEHTANAQHAYNQNNIYRDCADYYRESTEVGQECREECINNRNDCIRKARHNYGGSGGSAERRNDPCPPGTQPNPLGQCIAVIRANGNSDTSPDGCPPSSVRGPRDDCVPTLHIIGVFRSGDDWYIYCPKGTRPSPVDGGCVLDPGSGSTEVAVDIAGWHCPPGTSPGPDDSCVPTMPTATLEAPRRAVEPIFEVHSPGLNLELSDTRLQLDRLRIMKVDNPARAVEVTRQNLERKQ